MAYPNLCDPELSQMKTKDDENKDIGRRPEKHLYEYILKSLKIDDDYYKKKFKSLNRWKILLFINEILVGGGSTITSCTLSIVNTSAGIVRSSSSSLLTTIAILITNE